MLVLSVGLWLLRVEPLPIPSSFPLHVSPGVCSHTGDLQQQEAAGALQSEAVPVYVEGLRGPVQQWERAGTTVRISQIDAKRILTSLYLSEDYFDVIDIDSFGRCVALPLAASKHVYSQWQV